jgi:hypothetical protein
MNKENAREYLPLVQALANGKTLQIDAGAGWIDLSEETNFVFDPEDYRIKPEPRTFEMWLFNPMGRMYPFVEGEECFAENEDWERITVQEVLK